jgi:hypothetical protein
MGHTTPKRPHMGHMATRRHITNNMEPTTKQNRQHGLKLDIIYEDQNYPAIGRYNQIYYWDQKIKRLDITVTLTC